MAGPKKKKPVEESETSDSIENAEFEAVITTAAHITSKQSNVVIHIIDDVSRLRGQKPGRY